MFVATASVPYWLRVWAVEKWLATKPCSTLSSKLLEMFDALLVPNQCGEGSHDLRRLVRSSDEVLWNCEEWKLLGARTGKLRGDLLRRGGWKRRGLGN
ncbi:hypothetical protein DEO72_LG6g1078 [Vigna unguiculata]|uniref:Uncharacterized protein n=1 Tax=Vigna unguiculata TaxID=3917 RepID=A0A4D6M8C5_VIGUN|nr:hypothetical protein DEO72_LG6g1078 [Vigna unguiculata]